MLLIMYFFALLLLQLDFYLGGDWKFLALVTGIDAATSEHACIWCKCPKEDRWDTSMHWYITNPDEGARCVCVCVSLL